MNRKKEEARMKNTAAHIHINNFQSASFMPDSISLNAGLLCMGMCRMLSVPVRLSILA